MLYGRGRLVNLSERKDFEIGQLSALHEYNV